MGERGLPCCVAPAPKAHSAKLKERFSATLTSPFRAQVGKIGNAICPGAVSNPFAVVEQITTSFSSCAFMNFSRLRKTRF
ncbi:hypothetical protein GCM10010991_37580 [Gemmobacter aquaticus]|uniref:Uncharacterized protein n=1 Tax=Gemmobacter aquaticus TaxID=490185 RepID=A0A917YMS9_9RHOB|nr:hypothetical protein GCM10010991_37580 [Gemmobacter aquaticus]